MEHDTRGYIENDDLKELFYDPTKNDLDQFEQLMVVFGINYNKGVYDVFALIFSFYFYFRKLIFIGGYLFLIGIYVYNSPKDPSYAKNAQMLTGILVLYVFVLYFVYPAT